MSPSRQDVDAALQALVDRTATDFETATDPDIKVQYAEDHILAVTAQAAYRQQPPA